MTTSAYFSVQLPPSLTDEQFLRVFEWAKHNCLKSNIIRENDGGFMLIAQRADERDARNRQKLILTNYKHWSIDVSKQPKGWLKILTEEEFNAMNEQNVDTCDNDGSSLQNAGDDTEIAAELTSMTKPPNDTNNTPSFTPVTKPAFSRCTSAKLELPLPPTLLTDPAFFIAAR